MGSIPYSVFFTCDFVLGHHPPILVMKNMTMLNHMSCELVCLEPNIHTGGPCGGELQRVVPISYLVPNTDRLIKFTSIINLLDLEGINVMVVWMEFDILEH